jgi:predicted PurR-regulated permease PerM
VLHNNKITGDEMAQDARDFYSKTSFIIFFIIIIILSLMLAASYMIALFTGGVMAFALKPLLQKGILVKLKPNQSAFIIVLALLVIVVVPLALSILNFIQQAIKFENYFFANNKFSLNSLVGYLDTIPLIKHLNIDSSQIEIQIRHWFMQIGNYTKLIAMDLMQEIPLISLQLLITIISCYVFLTQGEQFFFWLSNKIPLKTEIKKSLILSFSRSSKSVVWSSLSAAGFQGLAILCCYLFFNVPGAFLAGGATFIFNFLPIVGAAPFWIIGGGVLFWKGLTIQLIIWVVIAIIASILESLVRILVLKGAHGLHPLVGMVAVFGGLQLFGFYGVLIGPMIVALLISMCEVLPQMWEELKQ